MPGILSWNARAGLNSYGSARDEPYSFIIKRVPHLGSLRYYVDSLAI